MDEEQKTESRSRKMTGEKTGVLRWLREIFIIPGMEAEEGYFVAFFLPVLVMLVTFVNRRIWPFGDNQFLRTDLYHQYAPFFSELQYKLQHGGSLLYSWDIGMGVNFSALYAYYLASPVNWIVALIPKSHLIEFITVLIVLKIALSGVTFTYYLNHHLGMPTFGAGIFGVFYALSGYQAAYSWNIMWLDCILMFPLILLGLERLVFEGKGLFYGIALGFSILSNYYISIMICLFMIVYFGCLLILRGACPWKKFWASAGRFAFYSLLAGALAAVMLLPEIAALRRTASADMDFPKTWETYFPIFDMIARHMCGVTVETGLDHWPNVFCGTAVFLMVPMYFVSRRIDRKQKMVNGALLIFFYASFSINILNFIWHGLHYPNSLPCRQSFIYIALLLTMCCRVYQNLDELSERRIGMFLAGAIGFVLLAEKTVTDDAFKFPVFYAAIGLLGLYALLMFLYRKRRFSAETMAVLLILAAFGENLANTMITSVPTTSRASYTADNDGIRMLTGERPTDVGFYRIDKRDYRTKNDGAWMNFPSPSLFSSMTDANMTSLFSKLGCEGSINAYSTQGVTPLVNSLFSIRYTLYNKEQNDPNLHFIQESAGMYLYENPDVLSVGFMLPEGLEKDWKLSGSIAPEVQNHLAELLGFDDLMNSVSSQEKSGMLSFTADESGVYYIRLSNRSVKKAKLTVNGRTQTYEDLQRDYLIPAGYVNAGQYVSLESTSPVNEEPRGTVYRYDFDALKQVTSVLGKEQLNVSEWKDSFLSGTVTTAKGGDLLLSIPYDKGWSVTVDGKKSIIDEAFGSLSKVKLDPGTHRIELRYMPQGLIPGAAISGAAVLLMILLAVFGRRRDRRAAQIPAEYHHSEELELKGEHIDEEA
ncbi:YfhO family protein [[Clostridium] aminophilum]|uniref:YfhO family protein n=2 Tax=[Clostridium] aminophilum TaxID=1526 RepID=UPI0026EE81CE|nr:YfhO family protein [[Clostridium] aminophilum]MDD6196435.1 YfhO family protein [[Clostridium] aminophilum]